jgi:hypothetical protein
MSASARITSCALRARSARVMPGNLRPPVWYENRHDQARDHAGDEQFGTEVSVSADVIGAR